MVFLAAGCEQVGIDQADARSCQLFTFDECEQGELSDWGNLWQRCQARDYFLPICKRTEREFGGNKAVLDDFAEQKPTAQLFDGRPKMIDPDRAIDYNHQNLRRSGAFACRSLPPSAASPLAASVWTN
jgi:hypothetical protein